MNALSIAGLTVTLGGRAIVQDVSLEIAAGSVGALLGASGAGKSTLLRAVAGLAEPSAGRIAVGDRVLFEGRTLVAPEDRRVGFQFQGFALWPHLTVVEHLDFVLVSRGIATLERRQRIADVLVAVGLASKSGQRPGTLSGGEKQRLALARALVARPELVLLDEPTGSLDPTTAGEVRAFIADLNQRFGVTVLFVTHDQAEAFGLAERVHVMVNGRIIQAGAPEELWNAPTSLAVARFVGEGALLEGMMGDAGLMRTSIGNVPARGGSPGARGMVLVRPDKVQVGGQGPIAARVHAVSFRGTSFRVTLKAGAETLYADLPTRPAVGTEVRVTVLPSGAFISGGEPA